MNGPRIDGPGPDYRNRLSDQLLKLDELVRVLRRDCPWDREQGVNDIVTYTLEETYELIDAAHAGDGDEVVSELGDLLFHIFFLASLAEERGWGDLPAVAAGIREKLVRRHPHVFGEAEKIGTAAEVVDRWEALKRERRREGIFHDMPADLPSPLFAQRVQARAAAVGFDWERAEPVFEKLDEEADELREALAAEPEQEEGTDRKRGPETATYHETGDMLFAVVNLARKLRVDPELALRSAALRFQQRVEGAAALAAADGEDFAGLSLERQEEYYQRAK